MKESRREAGERFAAAPFGDWSEGFPAEVIEGIKDSIDCNLYFFGEKVSILAMYLIVTITVLLLIGIYILLHVLRKKEK